MSVPQPYLNSDKTSFAYSSANKRWPSILNGVLIDLKHEVDATTDVNKKAEADTLLALFAEIKEHVMTDAPVRHLEGTSDAEIYNSCLDEMSQKLGKPVTWHTGPWMATECILYRELEQAVKKTQHWKDYDFFARVKNDTFEKSSDAVAALAKRYRALVEAGTPSKSDQAVVFHEIIETSLWGNATDLSLLPNMSIEELKKLQVASEHREKDKLLINDFDKVWKALNSQQGGRVDFVLDNAGFELYTDLVLALFLLDVGLAEQIVLHPKSQPWFVSDVTPRDWGVSLVQLLQDEKKFPTDRADIDFFLGRLLKYTHEGVILVRESPFWTSPLPYWEIRKGGAGGGDGVWQDLRSSKLVLFKGDLNYRKLTGDVAWPRTTPFKQAIRGLADSGIKFVTMRTIKADVVVGLPEGKEQELDEHWKKERPDQLPGAWAWSGSYAVVNYYG